MRSISSTLDPGQTKADPIAAKHLSEAYRSLFLSGDINADVVLVDLMEACAFYHTLPYDAPVAALCSHNARRRVGERIFAMLRLTDDERRALEAAIRTERQAG